MTRAHIVLILCLAMLLTACQTGVGITIGNVSLWGSKTIEAPKPTKPLTLFDAKTFDWFGTVFWNELQEKRIITDSGKATVVPPEPASTNTAGGEYVPESYGEALYTRLSLSFLWPVQSLRTSGTNRQENKAALLQTHSDCPSVGERVTVSQFGLHISGEFESHEYTLVALLDWNGNNARDWLVKHINTNTLANTTTTRMLIIPSPEPQGIFRAKTVWAEECKGNNCTTYVRETLPEFTGETAHVHSFHPVSGAMYTTGDDPLTPVRAPEALN